MHMVNSGWQRWCSALRKTFKKVSCKQNLTGIRERSPVLETFCWGNTYFLAVTQNNFSKKWGVKIVQQTPRSQKWGVSWPLWPPGSPPLLYTLQDITAHRRLFGDLQMHDLHALNSGWVIRVKLFPRNRISLLSLLLYTVYVAAMNTGWAKKVSQIIFAITLSTASQFPIIFGTYTL